MSGLLVIGNGFDLYHGMNTRYYDFLAFLSELCDGKYAADEEICNDVQNVFPGFNNSPLVLHFLNLYKDGISKDAKWIDMEAELKIYVHNLMTFIDRENEDAINKPRIEKLFSYRINHLSIEKRSIVITLKSMMDSLSTDSCIFKSEYKDAWGYLSKKEILEVLTKDLDGITGLLKLYLETVEPKTREVAAHRDFIKRIEPSFVLSFNYTNTFQKLYGIDRTKVCYYHGSIEDDNMVLGYDDMDQSTDDIRFKKYYRRLINKTDYRYENQKEDGHGGYEMYPLHIFGHSLDVSDEDILRKLLEASVESHIYYKDEDDRTNKILNLIKIIGKEKTINDIQMGYISLEQAQ